MGNIIDPLPHQALISIPSSLDGAYRTRLESMKNVCLSIHDGQTQPFIDIGDNTFILISAGDTLLDDVADGVLPEQLKQLATSCEYPVLLIVGSPFPRARGEEGRERAVAGFLSYLELFTRIRAIQAPNKYVALTMLQVMAKQTQRGFQSLGLDQL